MAEKPITDERAEVEKDIFRDYMEKGQSGPYIEINGRKI